MKITDIRYERAENNTVYFSVFGMYKFLRGSQISKDTIDKNKDLFHKYQGETLKGKKYTFTWAIASSNVEAFVERVSADDKRGELAKSYASYVAAEELLKVQQLSLEEQCNIESERSKQLEQDFKECLIAIQEVIAKYMEKL